MPLPEDDEIREVLDYLGGDLDPSILIGGWATHFRVGGEISHDIDLIVTNESRHRVQAAVSDLSTTSQSGGSTKQRGEVEGIHVDIYTPHESKLGSRLLLRAEVLIEYTEPLDDTRWLLLIIEAHILTKMAAILDRHASTKGEKDARELLSLFRKYDADINSQTAAEIAVRAASTDEDLVELIGEAFERTDQLTPASKEKREFLASLRRDWVGALSEAIRARVPRTKL